MNADAIATQLIDALDRRSIIERFTRLDSTFDNRVAYGVSAEILRRRRARGETPIGRKIGFTNRFIWDEYGVSAPMWGPVYDTTVTFLSEPSGRLAISHLSQPRIEPEIVLHFRESPEHARDDDELLATIDWIAHGFEIVQTHFLDWKFGLADTIADFGLHGALIVGPPQPVERFTSLSHRLRTFTITLAKDGSIAAQGTGSNVLDGPFPAALFLVRVLRDQQLFDCIRPGEIVTTGTLTPALPIRAGETWTTSLSGIDLPGATVHFD
ncbi:MAG: 2-keto-4-pentenoate hydratase [Vicinamibacterales bacterium]